MNTHVSRTHVVLDSRQCRYAPLQPDRYLLYADRMVSGTSQTAASCQTACDSERHFRCRSFSVYVVLGLMQCSMSSSASPAYEVWNCLFFFFFFFFSKGFRVVIHFHDSFFSGSTRVSVV
jgi:hypothetical protein